MAVEPFSICLFVIEFVRISYKIRSLRDEMHTYRKTLQVISELLCQIIATRDRLTTQIPNGSWIEEQLKEAGTELEQAQQMVGHPRKNRNGVLAMKDVVEWSLKHKHAVKACITLLNFHHNTLLRILDILVRQEQSIHETQSRAIERYFQGTRTQWLTEMSTRAERNSIIYSGVGVQMRRPRLLSGSQQQMVHVGYQLSSLLLLSRFEQARADFFVQLPISVA